MEPNNICRCVCVRVEGEGEYVGFFLKPNVKNPAAACWTLLPATCFSLILKPQHVYSTSQKDCISAYRRCSASVFYSLSVAIICFGHGRTHTVWCCIVI